MIKPHARLRVDTLVALIGVEATANLCHLLGGHRVPRRDQYRTWEQRVRLLHDWLQGGYTQRDLAAKYSLSPAVVKRTLLAFELRHTFAVDVLACPRCGGRMRVIATIDDPVVIRKIATHLGLPTEVPASRPPPGDLLAG